MSDNKNWFQRTWRGRNPSITNDLPFEIKDHQILSAHTIKIFRGFREPKDIQAFLGWFRLFRASISDDFFRYGKKLGETGNSDRELLISAAEQLMPKSTAITEANIVVMEIRAMVEAERAKADSEKQYVESMKASREEDFKESKTLLTQLRQSRVYRPENFGWVLGLFFIACSGLMLFADIPISESVCTVIFDFLQTDSEVAAENSTRLVIDWKRLAWLVPVSLGLLSLFIKVWVETTFDSNIVQQVERSSPKPIWKKGSFWFYSIVFLLFIATMVMLGYARFLLKSNLEDLIKHALTVDDKGVPLGSQGYSSQTLQDGKIMAAFILITLLLPLVSGILAHMGYKKIYGFMLLQMTHIQTTFRRFWLWVVMFSVKRAAKKRASWQPIAEYTNQIQFQNEFSKQLHDSYQRGIRVGHQLYAQSTDLYEMAELSYKKKALESND